MSQPYVEFAEVDLLRWALEGYVAEYNRSLNLTDLQRRDLASQISVTRRRLHKAIMRNAPTLR